MDKLVEMMTGAAHRVVVDMAQVNENRVSAALVEMGWTPVSRDDVVLAVRFLESINDLGPHGQGYQSKELKEVIRALQIGLDLTTNTKHSEYDDE